METIMLIKIDRFIILEYGLPLLAIGFSLVAIAISLFAFIRAKKTDSTSKRVADRSKSAKHTAQQSIELTIASLIFSNRSKMDEAEYELELFRKNNSQESDEFRKKVYLDAIEEYLKTFDRACIFYLDERFDKDKFIKEYKMEIRRIVEKEDMYSRFFNRNIINANFKNIQKVYEKWENIEK